ncbi:MAG: glucosaminidase domain-containing protein [Sulfitobacter sp.]
MSFFPAQDGGIFGQGAFQIDQNSTPEMIRAKRAQLAALMPQYGKARYVGEGLGQLFSGIATGRKNRALDKFEGERRSEAAGLFNSIFTGGSQNGGNSGPMSVLGMRRPAPPTPPSPEQAIADNTMAALGKPQQQPQKAPQGRDEFIQAMMPHAMRVSQQTGLDPRIIIAQAAQETGWGKHAPGNNYFGIKSHGKPGGNSFATNEVVNGQTVRINDSFRGYDGMGDSVDGYAQFLQENPRYRDMLSAPDLEGQLAALGKSGYATDPNYANSVGSIAHSINVPGGSFQPGPGTQVAQNGPQINNLMMAAQNQWLSPQQQNVINGQIRQLQGQQQSQLQRQQGREDYLWKQQQSQNDPLRQLQIQQAQLNLEQDRAGISDAAKVQSSVALDDGTAVLIMNDGTRRVLAPDGTQVKGQQAADAIRSAREYTVENQRDIYGARRTGTLDADIELGGIAKATEDVASATVKAGVSAWEDYGKLQSSIGTIGEAIAAIDSGAESGLVYKHLPNVTEASASLNNAMDRMGLDVVGSVTFGALSEGELRLAMNTAVPRDLSPPELRIWLVKKQAAQEKASAMLADAAQFMTTPGNTINGWIDRNQSRNETPKVETPPTTKAAIEGGIPAAPAEANISQEEWEALWPTLTDEEKAAFQ